MNSKIFKWRNYLPLFFLLVILVSSLQFFLLRPFEIGFTPDDWSFVFLYKSLGQNPILKLNEVWKERGAYTTFFIYYNPFLFDLSNMKIFIIYCFSFILMSLICNNNKKD